MRFLTTEIGRKCINIDKIEDVSISKVNSMAVGHEKYILVVNNQGFYAGDFIEVKLRYINLIDMLSNGDTPSGTFIPNNFMVVMKNDGTFVCEQNSLWAPELKEDDFA